MERIRTETVRGNAPECPQCHNWNALLDRFDHSGLNRTHFFQCRDCGFEVEAKRLRITIKEMDAPGMDCLTTYHPVAEVNGEDF